MTKLKTRDLVTIRKIREANTRIISGAHIVVGTHKAKSSGFPSVRLKAGLNLSEELISSAGRSAMSKLKRA